MIASDIMKGLMKVRDYIPGIKHILEDAGNLQAGPASLRLNVKQTSYYVDRSVPGKSDGSL